jgi:hypothetical protein
MKWTTWIQTEPEGDKDILGFVEIVAYYNLSTRLFESLSTVDP